MKVKEQEELNKKTNNKFNIPMCEPVMEFRFSIDFYNNKSNKIEFHEQAVKDYKLSYIRNDDRKLKYKKFLNLKINLINFIPKIIKPEQIFDINKVKINFLDPTGIVIDYYLMNVELDNFELNGSYGNNELSTYKLSFFVSNLEDIYDEKVENN